MRVAVTGATGLLGRFLVPHLLARGHVIHALKRQTSNVAGFASSKNLHWFKGDLTDVDSLEALVERCDGVVHSAFQHIPGRYRGGEGNDPKAFMAINLQCTLAFLDALVKAGVKRTVFVSSRAVFDGYSESTNPIGDDAQTDPQSLYGELKARTEDYGNTLENIGFCSLRPTGIYGLTHPVSRSKWFELVAEATRQSTSRLGYSMQQRTEVHGKDVASAIELLLMASNSHVEHKSFNCSDIAVSELQLAELSARIFHKQELDLDALPESIAPVNPMACDRLAALGWRPGGLPQLAETLAALLAA